MTKLKSFERKNTKGLYNCNKRKPNVQTATNDNYWTKNY